MSNLVVIAYPDEQRAAQVLAQVRNLSNEYLIDFEDACYVVKDSRGKIKLYQANSLAGAGAAMGGFWGLLIGLLFFVPVLGLAIGAIAGGLIMRHTDYGIDDKFAKQLTATLQPGSSAIFVLVQHATPDKVLPIIAQYGGTVLQTSLPKETQDKLQDSLNKGAAQHLPEVQAAAEAQTSPPVQTAPETGTTTAP